MNQNFVVSLQQTFNKDYNAKLVNRLHSEGFNDSKPFDANIHVGLYLTDYTMRNVHLTVQTKQPETVIGEYHVWIRPLSKEVYLGLIDGTFKHVDEVYAILNGSSSILPTAILDDTRTWE